MPLQAAAAIHNFQIIHLDLAREPGHPQGSVSDRYTLVLPLKADGRVDQAECKGFPDLCTVSRTLENGSFMRGIVRRDADHNWLFDFGEPLEPEIAFGFSKQKMVPGEYVSVRRDGEDHTYRIISLQPL